MELSLEKYNELIFASGISQNFDALALRVFAYQYSANSLYREYCNLLNRNKSNVRCITEIPFLPIEFFKNHKIISGTNSPELEFISSGTTGSVPSRHFVVDTMLYKRSLQSNFRYFFGNPSDYVVLGLLPSENERKNSSLIFMVKELIELSGKIDSGFYSDDFAGLSAKITELEKTRTKYLLFGVSYALLDFAEYRSQELKYAIIIETGGMKGRKKEITREELHSTLSGAFGVDSIRSEYGMTELLSQAYSLKNGIFHCPPQMKVLSAEISDPLTVHKSGRGVLNIIDLANIYSCAFIASSDLGTVFPDGSFTVDGRIDMAEIRGCNLLFE